MTDVEDEGAPTEAEGEEAPPAPAAFDFTTSSFEVYAEGFANAGEPLKAKLTIANVGELPGTAVVRIYVDGEQIAEVPVPEVEAGMTWDTGFEAVDLPPVGAGEHTFQAAVEPAGPNGGYADDCTLNITEA